MAMTALEIIHDLHEKKRPAPNWTNTTGIYADCSKYPDIEFYMKCPKCSHVHGSYKNMREAHRKRLCDRCNVETINKIKKMVKEVDSPKNRGKPGKGLSRITNEADELIPTPPGEEFDARDYILSTPHDSWIHAAMAELGDDQDTQFSVAPRSRAFLDDPDSVIKVELEGDDGTEWTLWRSEDAARAETLDVVRDQLQTDPGSFNQDWLLRFINRDALKEHFRDIAGDIEFLTEMDEQEQVDYLIRQGILNREDFYDDSDNFVPNEDLLEAGQEAFREKKIAEFDPMEWLRDVYGEEEALKQAAEAVGININAAADNAIATDGWQHFASYYDGSSTDLRSGAVAVRTH